MRRHHEHAPRPRPASSSDVALHVFDDERKFDDFAAQSHLIFKTFCILFQITDFTAEIQNSHPNNQSAHLVKPGNRNGHLQCRFCGHHMRDDVLRRHVLSVHFHDKSKCAPKHISDM